MTRARKDGAETTARRIPEFESRQEEARFWDTHDMTDYLGKLKPVRARFARSLSQGITARFDPETLEQIRKQAREALPASGKVGA